MTQCNPIQKHSFCTNNGAFYIGQMVLNTYPLAARTVGVSDHTIVHADGLNITAVRGRDNHQRARCKAATGVDQSRERGCESLERDQGGRQPADSLDNVNDCRCVHGLSATAWLRREWAKRASVGSALPFAQAFTTGNE